MILKMAQTHIVVYLLHRIASLVAPVLATCYWAVVERYLPLVLEEAVQAKTRLENALSLIRGSLANYRALAMAVVLC